MESAENREQSLKANQPEESIHPSSLSKQETIKLLNDSIDKLELTIKDISENSAKELPSSDSINNLLNTTQELVDSVTPVPPEVTPKDEATAPEAAETATIVPQKTSSAETKETLATDTTYTKSQPSITNKTKQKSAKANNQPVPKNPAPKNSGIRIISAVVLAIVLIVAIWYWLPQIKMALSPDSEIPEIALNREIQPNSELPSLTLPNTDENINQAVEENVPVNTQIIEVEPETIEPVAIPQDLTSPGRIKNLKIETIEPELTFTPEQTLVAAIQSKLAEITGHYDAELFNYVKVNLADTSLVIKVTNNWYELNSSRQDKLANEILKRSRQLNFSTVQFEDSTGTIIARSPVVGDHIIILQTSKND